jgi:hypothetical protein
MSEGISGDESGHRIGATAHFPGDIEAFVFEIAFLQRQYEGRLLSGLSHRE